MIKPIKTYDAYFIKNDNKKLYGINKETVEEIKIIDQDGEPVKLIDFFKSGDDLYFSVKEIEITEMDGKEIKEPIIGIAFYRQKDGLIDIIKKLPEKPVQSQITYNSDEFKILKTEYNKEFYSDLRFINKETKKEKFGIERFGIINNFIHFPGIGIYINVPVGRGEDIGLRIRGLYFWDINKKCIEYIIRGEGILYK